VALAAAAARTKRIRLTSAVTVLSSDDPVRVYQQVITFHGISPRVSAIHHPSCLRGFSTR
jgi:alkanesulfonate monooxygenase SsuD/methylene tetrahydromethanopterin reductase-like flavin-dependent oxidoreductase (luciferase family)